jgi:hypothetical protein
MENYPKRPSHSRSYLDLELAAIAKNLCFLGSKTERQLSQLIVTYEYAGNTCLKTIKLYCDFIRKAADDVEVWIRLNLRKGPALSEQTSAIGDVLDAGVRLLECLKRRVDENWEEEQLEKAKKQEVSGPGRGTKSADAGPSFEADFLPEMRNLAVILQLLLGATEL